ncbi:hypothetical protein [Lapillicoccus sp.]|uniref:DUF6891 domain-containing protein n=1 Tax=Lapillicoccus sp. TaxID=1909287 RepID=UPI0025D9EDBD|nr:hypothetical protein [Lapillicoccus sp.]
MGFLDRFRQRKDDDSTVASPDPLPTGPAPSATAPQPTPTASVLVPAAEPTSRADQLEELEDSAREMVAPAFETRERIEESLVEQYVLDDDYDLTEDDVREVLRRVWQERLDEEATWADEGDYPRLEAAFAALDGTGIVARMNFACCQTCGHAEIDDERVDGSRGYVFFHQQDTERLAPGGTDLFLAFGGFDFAAGVDPSLVERARAGDEDAKQAAIVASEELVGAEVAGALRREGLIVEWDGTCAQRIRVTGLDWRKRLPVGPTAPGLG